MTALGSIRRTACAIVILVAAGCGGAGATPTAAPVTIRPTPTDQPITLQAPAEIAAGSTFTVSWAGKETAGDFFVIVPAGATTWEETDESPYYNATMGNPITLTAPKTAGVYEIWFLKGEMARIVIIKARAPLAVT